MSERWRSEPAWRCSACAEVVNQPGILRAPNPFTEDAEDFIVGCSTCGAVESFERVCDASTCRTPASHGTPSPSGYRFTCDDHTPEDQ